MGTENMENRYELSVISEEQKKAIKNMSAYALPDSPAAYGMKVGAVKPKFWRPLVDGNNSLVGLINALIEKLNDNFKNLDNRLNFQQIRINPITNMWEISADGGQTWSSTGVKATGEKGDTGHEFVTIYLAYDTKDDLDYNVTNQVDDGVCDLGLVMIEKNSEKYPNAAGGVYRKQFDSDGNFTYKFLADLTGNVGPKGPKPTAGVDYWTKADKDEIKAYVDAAILNGEW